MLDTFIKKHLFQILVYLVTMIGGGSIAMFKIDATAEEVASLKEVIGYLQLDMALICTEVVRERGGNPLQECKTSRGNR